MRYFKAATIIMLTVFIAACNIMCVYASDKDDRISAYVDEFQDKTCCEAVSVVVIDHGKTAFYGDQDKLYQIGSMTKAFTGLAAVKLIREGTLNEDSRLSELIPGFTAYYDSKPYEITIGDLLAQTSGYTNKEAEYPSAQPGQTLQEWAEGISGKELASKPGDKYAYSNVNYDLLGAVIERATGRSYKDFMTSEILTPLGLVNTYVSVPEERIDIVSGSRPGFRHAFRYDIPVAEGRIPAGYFYSDTKDMLRWMQIWSETADITDEYKELVTEVKNHLNDTDDYYSGWQAFENGVIGHSGGTPNYSSRMVFSKTGATGVCVLTNMNVAASTDGLCNGIYEIVDDKVPAGIPTDVWTVFDIIFSTVTLVGLLMIIPAIFIRKRRVAWVFLTGIILITVAICIVMPVVFGSGLGEILFTWAPYSMTCGLIILVIDIMIFGFRICKLKKS